MADSNENAWAAYMAAQNANAAVDDDDDDTVDTAEPVNVVAPNAPTAQTGAPNGQDGGSGVPGGWSTPGGQNQGAPGGAPGAPGVPSAQVPRVQNPQQGQQQGQNDEDTGDRLDTAEIPVVSPGARVPQGGGTGQNWSRNAQDASQGEGRPVTDQRDGGSDGGPQRDAQPRQADRPMTKKEQAGMLAAAHDNHQRINYQSKRRAKDPSVPNPYDPAHGGKYTPKKAAEGRQRGTDMFAGFMVANAMGSLESDIGIGSIIKATSSMAVIWALSPGVRRRLSEVNRDSNAKMLNRFRTGEDFVTNKITGYGAALGSKMSSTSFFGSMKERARAAAAAQAVSKTYNERCALQMRDPDHAVPDVSMIAHELVATAEQTHEAMRMNWVTPAQAAEDFSAYVDGTDENSLSARCDAAHVDKETVLAVSRDVIAERIAEDPAFAAVFTETAHGSVAPSAVPPHHDGTPGSWDGKWMDRCLRPMEDKGLGAFSPRPPQSRHDHIQGWGLTTLRSMVDAYENVGGGAAGGEAVAAIYTACLVSPELSDTVVGHNLEVADGVPGEIAPGSSADPRIRTIQQGRSVISAMIDDGYDSTDILTTHRDMLMVVNDELRKARPEIYEAFQAAEKKSPSGPRQDAMVGWAVSGESATAGYTTDRDGRRVAHPEKLTARERRGFTRVSPAGTHRGPGVSQRLHSVVENPFNPHLEADGSERNPYRHTRTLRTEDLAAQGRRPVRTLVERLRAAYPWGGGRPGDAADDAGSVAGEEMDHVERETYSAGRARDAAAEAANVTTTKAKVEYRAGQRGVPVTGMPAEQRAADTPDYRGGDRPVPRPESSTEYGYGHYGEERFNDDRERSAGNQPSSVSEPPSTRPAGAESRRGGAAGRYVDRHVAPGQTPVTPTGPDGTSRVPSSGNKWVDKGLGAAAGWARRHGVDVDRVIGDVVDRGTTDGQRRAAGHGRTGRTGQPGEQVRLRLDPGTVIDHDPAERSGGTGSAPGSTVVETPDARRRRLARERHQRESRARAAQIAASGPVPQIGPGGSDGPGLG